jgi:hypothetical protein
LPLALFRRLLTLGFLGQSFQLGFFQLALPLFAPAFRFLTLTLFAGLAFRFLPSALLFGPLALFLSLAGRFLAAPFLFGFPACTLFRFCLGFFFRGLLFSLTLALPFPFRLSLTLLFLFFFLLDPTGFLPGALLLLTAALGLFFLLLTALFFLRLLPFLVAIRLINFIHHRAWFRLRLGYQPRRNAWWRRVIVRRRPGPAGQGHHQNQPVQKH